MVDLSVDVSRSQLAQEIAKILMQRKETVSVAESTTGGLISAALLEVPGASAYYTGGSVVYTMASRKAFLDIDKGKVAGLKPLTTEMVGVFADAARAKLSATWGIAELGASGPSDSPYGHPAGSSVIGISGPVSAAIDIRTGSADRADNMAQFTLQGLQLFLETLRGA